MASSSASGEEQDTPAVVAEFQEWFDRNSDSECMLFLVDHSTAHDGSVRLDMSFSSGETFSLICPDGYPHTPQPLFMIKDECEALSKWTKALNQFAADKRGQIKLSALLTRAVETLSNGQRQSGSSDVDEGLMDLDENDDDNDVEHMEDDEDDDLGLNDDDQFTTDWEIQMDLRKKRWAIKEAELRAQWAEEQVRLQMSDSQPKSKKSKNEQVKEGQQIFTHQSAAFQILSNEMIHLLKKGKEDGFAVDTVADSLYTWSVKIGSFPNDTELHKQLTALSAKFGYDYVELQLDFIPDFPFYPPLLRVVRPRFRGSIVQSLANIDLLKVTYWNPAKTVHDVLKQIKDILLLHARLDVDAARNDAVAHPEGAYHPIEDFLIKLALATECRPRANTAIINVDSLEKAPQMKRNSHPTPPVPIDGGSPDELNSSVGWAKGTGYGSGRSSSGWNPEDHIRAKKEKDRQILRIMQGLLQALTDRERSMDTTELFAVIEGSALIPFVEVELANLTFIEIGRHPERYRLLFDLLSTISVEPALLPLLCPLPNQKKCLMALLEEISRTAADYLQTIETHSSGGKSTRKSVDEACSDDLPSLNLTKRLVRKLKKKTDASGGPAPETSQAETSKQQAQASRSDAVDEGEIDLEKQMAIKIAELFEQLQTQLAVNGLVYSGESAEPSTSGDAETEYQRRLRPLLFGTAPVVVTANAPWCHAFANKSNESLNGREVKAVFKEITALKQSLPLALSSSIFVRYDDAHMHLLQALITGPDKTPYSNGCFLFDICFPSRYPLVPPLVMSRTTGGLITGPDKTPYSNGCFLFDICFPSRYPLVPPLVMSRTTGGGRVRFNPNLYDNGKVCLSLLGTWGGEQGESWSPGTSTLLQVLVSIQSLILIEDPYYNEPGYESQRGTPEGTRRSNSYNQDVRSNCAKWAILEQLKMPPPAFADVVREHYRLKRDLVKQQLDEWQKLDKGIKDSVKNIKSELDKL
uniref:UBC core domain-containing protein n=1 Tax=Plectus sambesii TaxID=2011161 RepID=A0A914V5Q6_9BILA